jgi:hypothetical protein
MMMMIQKRMTTMTILLLLLLLMLLSGCNVRILILMLSGYNVTSVRNGGNFHQRTTVSSSMSAAAVVSYCDADEDAVDAQHHEVGVSGWKLRQTHTGKTYYILVSSAGGATAGAAEGGGPTITK